MVSSTERAKAAAINCQNITVLTTFIIEFEYTCATLSSIILPR